MPTLFTLGDSFVTGYDESIANSYTTGKEYAFPTLVANILNLSLENLGVVGNDNEMILRDCVKISKGVQKDDIVLIVWSSPFRYQHSASVNDILINYIRQINTANHLLKGKNILQTQAFCPLAPYEFSKEYITQFEPENFLYWGIENNTLMDFVSNTWLDSTKTNIQRRHSNNPREWIQILIPFLDKERKDFTKCMHFNKNGHKRVAAMIAAEIGGRFSLSPRSGHAQISKRKLM